MSVCRAARVLASTHFIAVVATVVTVSRPADAAEFGPPPGAVLSVEKLSRIDGFMNAEVAAGKIPGAILLIQRHGKPVYYKRFGLRDPDAGVAMTDDAIFPFTR